MPFFENHIQSNLIVMLQFESRNIVIPQLTDDLFRFVFYFCCNLFRITVPLCFFLNNIFPFFFNLISLFLLGYYYIVIL